MSKALRNFPVSDRDRIAKRRVAFGDLPGGLKGNGYLAAKDYLSKPRKKGKADERV